MKTKEDQKKKAERFRLNYDKGYICAQCKRNLSKDMEWKYDLSTPEYPKKCTCCGH